MWGCGGKPKKNKIRNLILILIQLALYTSGTSGSTSPQVHILELLEKQHKKNRSSERFFINKILFSFLLRSTKN